MRLRLHTGTLAVLLTLTTVFLTPEAAAQEVEPGSKGAVKADITFRPRPNGFNFPNWGQGENPQGDLTAEDARCLFGDGVCARFKAGRCEPTPAARMWIAAMNREMGAGHCEGLAALSSAFHAGRRRPQDYGGASAYDLKVTNGPLLRMISTLFVTQMLDPVRSATRKTADMSTRQIVDTLAQAMQGKQEFYTLGIYGAEGGHAITPYAVEELSSGRYLIHVYDNNYPGAGNVVEVDTAADRWRYAAAALNPGEKAAPWEGKGGSMDLTPLSSRFQPLTCPFCTAPRAGPICDATTARPPNTPTAAPPADRGPASSPASRPPAPPTVRTPPSIPAGSPPVTPPAVPRPMPGPSSIQTTANCDQLTIRDRKSGRDVTFAGGTNQIPGMILTRRRGARGCTIVLPPGSNYELTVAGRKGEEAQKVTTTVFRPGQVIRLDGASVAPGQRDTIGIGDSSFSYKPASNSRPDLAIGTDKTGGKDGYYQISNLALSGGRVFSLDERDDGRIVFDSDDPQLTTFDLLVQLEDERGMQESNFDDVDFDDQGQAILGLNDDGALIFDMDSDSDGLIDADDRDDDGDGQPDAIDADDDNDGTPDAQETEAADEDGDGTPDAADADDDNDGTPDLAEGDDDADEGDDDETVDDAQDDADHDADDDSTRDEDESEDDNDGTRDEDDSDDDNDGTPDEEEEEEEEESDEPPPNR